jgi:hypothetical protein
MRNPLRVPRRSTSPGAVLNAPGITRWLNACYITNALYGVGWRAKYPEKFDRNDSTYATVIPSDDTHLDLIR